jgi:1-hydroxycarotenoid 3,4-desaturase
MPTKNVIVVGAGIGGLVTAVQLAARGIEVDVLERAAAPGGKMREVQIGDQRIDAGPTVFTMRWIFEEIFAEAGASLTDYLTLRPFEILARHAWSEHERFDLYADEERTIEAIGDFAGAAEAKRYRGFCEHARTIFDTLDEPFIRSSRPNPLSLVSRCGVQGFPGLRRIKPFDSLWQALGEHFKDERLRQLFGRYSTYCGSSPFLAPATLMLIAHVERQGVWSVEGGMHQTAVALARLAESLGATIRYDTDVAEILVERGRACGVRLGTGERLDANAVVFNGDAAALAGGGWDPASVVRSPRRRPPSARSRRSPGASWRKPRAFPCCVTACFSVATMPPSSKTSSGALGSRTKARSISAHRTATPTTRHRRRAPSASSASSTPRRRATAIHSTPRRSSNASSGYSPYWNAVA